MNKISLPVSILLIAIVIGAIVFGYTQRSRTPNLPDPPLKELADKHNVELGNFAILNRLDEQPYRDILTSEFDFVLADNTPNWHFTDGGLRPSKDEFNFKQMDEVMRFAQENNMPVQAHHYLWGEEKWLPDWLKEGNFSPEELNKLIETHIKTVGSRYRGQIREWTVVNEAFSRNSHIYGLRDWWADNTGGLDYIDQAFRWAREADPDSKLILNDFLNESRNDISDAMYEYLKSALARGVPIDGIGMQMHIDGTHPPTKDEVVSNMKRFEELGLDVYVTEFDVNMNDLQASSSNKNQVQARIYNEMLSACLEVDACKSFALLGITDKETWYNYVGLEDPRPLPFDDKYRPKPAYFSMREALQR